MPSARSDGKHTASNGYEATWRAAAEALCQAGTEGLSVRCPACHRRGTVISKWEPRTRVKPLYAVHCRSRGGIKQCLLPPAAAEKARAKVRVEEPDVAALVRMGRPFVLVSGGGDSTATLLYLDRIAKANGATLTALHADTTAGFPEVEEYVQSLCGRVGVELVTVRPDRDYFELAKRWGIPGVRARWCCETLKVAPMRRYLSGVAEHKIIFDGIRAAESPLRATYTPVWVHPAFRALSVSPILHWSDADVANYIAAAGVPPNPTAAMGTSGECWCGAYKSRCDFEALYEVHPEIFAKLIDVEKAQDGRFTFLFEDGAQLPLAALADELGARPE